MKSTDQAPREQQPGTSLWRMSRYLLHKWFCVESAITWKIPTQAVSQHCSQQAGCALSRQSSRNLRPRSFTQESRFGTLISIRVAASTALGTLPQTHSQQTHFQHWGHRSWDGWWSHLVQAGVCLEAKVLPVPSLNPEALAWAGYAQLWLILTPLTLFVPGAAPPRSQKRFSRNPQSQAQPE